MFHFLLYVAKGSSSLNIREKRMILNRISNLARVNLTHTLGAPLSHSQATFSLSFRFMDRATLPDYRAPHLVPHNHSCSATLFNRAPTSSHIHFIHPIPKREWGKVHLQGRLVTRLAAYHIYGMWLVLSNA